MFGQKHYYLSHFWQQLWNSVFIAVATGVLTLFVATFAAFAISRLKVRGGRTVMNLALFTYFIPAAFLAVPMYRTMGLYGLLNSQWALILAMVTIASPYAIWVLSRPPTSCRSSWTRRRVMDGATADAALPAGVPAADGAVAGRGRAPMRCCSPGTNISTPSCCSPRTPTSRCRSRSATSLRRTIRRGSC